MREIKVSVDVFASIWADRKHGENSEDDILRRVFLEKNPKTKTHYADRKQGGYFDNRNKVFFPNGFTIFRQHKDKSVTATVISGKWATDDGRTAQSINEISRKLLGLAENVWLAWQYKDENGHTRPINALREIKMYGNDTPSRSIQITPKHTWRSDVFQALKELGGQAHLSALYETVKKVRENRGANIPDSLEAIVRRELEYNSSDSETFLQRHDLFFSVEGLGSGIWGIRDFQQK
ncbi:hypothetical protein [Thalassospira xiamenensis]|jgi:hypothetical protein|uniref:Uncharacterized protein n=1 Tax=Thalassospira xiamenensis TaxID=220697 RepID=A0A367XBL3_9PROT|nr:hypothetical protein [Thalassospira xiamenensis]KZB54725.1 hypothetical protein AUP41_19275 [Thalassospira xiamenensis]MCK2168965.1 hypothetical protein [Thalassospira xiamenensis]RCK51034.1 hypothetical protein TH44_09725 [Thalassospira xiamenensis]